MNSKRADWVEVKREFPALAKFIQRYAQEFGKPMHMKITREDGSVVLDTRKYFQN